MARLILSINVTFDGNVDHRNTVADSEHHEYALTLLRGATGLILGRHTYELFERHWPEVARTGSGTPNEVAFARELDSRTRYVASRHRTTATWPGTVILSGDLSKEIRSLKQRESGYLVIFGSPGLAYALAELNEIDEYHLVVQPIIAGQGPTLFSGLSRRLELAHVETRTFRSGAVLNCFWPNDADPGQESTATPRSPEASGR